MSTTAPYGPRRDAVPRQHVRQTPPEPQRRRSRGFDFVSVIGELLITAGLIVGLFAFWQVFVTDWQVAGDTQDDLKAFTDEYGKAPNRISHDIRTTAPPEIGPVVEGKTFATMHVPRWDYMVIPVKQGVSSYVLDLGAAGHYPQTQMPHQLGNFAVAAHRRSYGSNFKMVHKLKVGDPIILETKNAWIVYRVKSTKIVLPSQSNVLLPVPEHPDEQPTNRIMTMTTCDPEYGNSHRFIVFSDFIHWIPRDTGIPEELAQGAK